MSVQIALLAPATRVASRKLGPVAGSARAVVFQRAGGLGDEHVGEHVRQVRDGGEDAVVGVGVDRGRPGADRRAAAGAGARRARPRCRRSGSGTRWRRRTGRRGRARRRVSAPASGWPPTNRSSRGAATTSRLVEPTSVTTQSSGAAASASPHRSDSPPTGTATNTAWASATASATSLARAVERAERQRALERLGRGVVAGDLAPSRSRAASADRAADQPDPEDRDPHPISVAPTRSGALCDRGPLRQAVEHLDGRLPADAPVGDRLAVDELGARLSRSWRPATRKDSSITPTIASLPAAICAATSAATAGWRSGSLPLLSWLRSIITRRGSPAALEQIERRAPRWRRRSWASPLPPRRMMWQSALPRVCRIAALPLASMPANVCATGGGRTASTATCTLPSVRFLKPTGIDRPEPAGGGSGSRSCARRSRPSRRRRRCTAA